MDEILLSNFMVLHDVIAEEACDLWIRDEARELDYCLHENPASRAERSIGSVAVMFLPIRLHENPASRAERDLRPRGGRRSSPLVPHRLPGRTDLTCLRG